MRYDIDLLKRTYFYFDKPVVYKLKDGKELLIHPVNLVDSEIFLSSVNILSIDKNSLASVEIIQMSYLDFICKALLFNEEVKTKVANILIICLKLNHPEIKVNKKGRFFIYDKGLDVTIDGKDFDEIKRIIMYQNFSKYDETYIDPYLKQSMDEMDSLKNKGKEIPSLERKIAIISSHTGITKKEQESMTFRSHCLLFEEVCGEVEFTTIRPVALFNGKGNEMDHWIYKNSKGKFDDYITSVDSYTRSMGSDKGKIKKVDSSSMGDLYIKQFDNFNK